MLLISVIALISLLAASVVLIWHISSAESSTEGEKGQHPAAGGRVQRSRRGQARAANAAETDESGVSRATANESVASSSTRSAKKRAKQARRQAAQSGESSRRVADEVNADSRDEEQASIVRSAYELAREKKDEQRNAEELAEEEEIRQAQEERKQREQAEFDAWKDLMLMDDAGEEANSREQLQERRDAMCARLKSGKVVELDSISAEFDMRCTEVISEIKHLEAEGVLTGVLDERGKYIYFSMEELQRLAQEIRSRGRISISAIAQEATDMLNMPAPDADASSLHEHALDALLAD
eukprot:jgi/Ulvmu1/1302/UM011_0029.1